MVRFDYDFMDDDFIILEWEKTPKTDCPNMEAISKPSILIKSTKHNPYDENRRALMQNHPLNYLVEHKRQALLTHPVIISLYTSKWHAFGFWVYYINLFIYALLMVLLNVYAYTVPPPYSGMPKSSSNKCIDIVDEPSVGCLVILYVWNFRNIILKF